MKKILVAAVAKKLPAVYEIRNCLPHSEKLAAEPSIEPAE
jgi:hypothetical protein